MTTPINLYIGWTNVHLMNLKSKDIELLRCLNQNGKASQRKLAASTGVALGTVSNHIKTLEKEKSSEVILQISILKKLDSL